jgi:hypothetical protein
MFSKMAKEIYKTTKWRISIKRNPIAKQTFEPKENI